MWDKVCAYLEKWDMIAPGMTVLVGFSGGADSAALLEFLWEYGKAHKVQVRALHVNHGIRGEEADRDQAFCERFCEERKIPLRVVYEDVPKIAKRERISTEEAGRKVRYAAFEQELSDGNADRVALAHHQNDQAETMLFHLMRGAYLRGLRGMEPVRIPYIRPFLCVTRQEIESWLLSKKISWVEDATNQELFYTRNRIRHQVLSPMEQILPGSTAHMARTASWLLELEDYVRTETERVWQASVRQENGSYGISLEAFSAMHPVMRREIVLRCLEQLMGGRKDLASVHVEHVCALADGQRGSRVTLPGKCVAVLGYEELLLKRGYGGEQPENPVLCIPGQEYVYMGKTFRFILENRDKNEEIPVNRYTKWFDYDKIRNDIILRTRQPGDYLELSKGMHKKLKDYLIDCKVPREERDQCILLADGSHIIWVTGMRISEAYKVTDQTKRVLKVQKLGDGGTENEETSY